MFTGFGLLKGEYKIKLREAAQPYALTAPRRVAIPRWSKVKEELARMEEMVVIACVEEPTEWCWGMVPRNCKICVDLTCLNENVEREQLILLVVDETLVRLDGATVFMKLDATSGFWQVPLHKDLMLLTTFITPEGRYYFKRLPFGISSAPAQCQHHTKLEQVKEAQNADNICTRLRHLIKNCWPNHWRDVHESLLPYRPEHSDLH